MFAGWCLMVGGGLWPSARTLPVIVVAVALMVGGQILNVSAFYRLGRVGAFFGDRLGHTVPWCATFPFTLGPHPQYLGAVLTIWGFFVIMRFPAGDWYLLPVVETVYYAVGAALEEYAPSRTRSG